MSFTAPEENQFRYKLEGYDRDWVDAGARRAAYYNNLSPGDYTFRVMACNNDGVWNSHGPTVVLSLQPHLWQTLWFRFAVTSLGLCLAAATARYATRKRMQAQLLQLEQQHAIEKERTRIAQDMHDDLGVRLSEILLLSDLTHRNHGKPGEVQALTGKISCAARELVDNLDAIVWAVNPKNDSLDKFSDYLCENVPMYLKMSGIQCSFDVSPDLPARPLSSELRHNLFLVVKEALHNVVKHAQATRVEIQLRLLDNSVIVGIADNGRGLPEKAGSNFGNGLSNMADRLKRVGGSLELASEPGKGTRISLRVPLHR